MLPFDDTPIRHLKIPKDGSITNGKNEYVGYVAYVPGQIWLELFMITLYQECSGTTTSLIHQMFTLSIVDYLTW